ncbi:ABC transporter substrate-binding protein [Rhodoligotrophos appendicifer]|uniref:ABC transporter substrate-binding protein n=2 Tax=Rhodoligotrophos appendicifer TaxID=987056 RepID=UPI0014796034
MGQLSTSLQLNPVNLVRSTSRSIAKRSLLVAFAGMLAASSAWAADYKQAPMLDAQVTAGTLPPVAERLPKTPRVIEPVEKVGKYGGTWRSGLVGGSDRNWLFRIAGYEPLVAWDREWSGKVVPNLAEAVTASEDGKTFTVKLREGLKWSDGKPFTSDDIGFFINDIVGNKELLPNGVDWISSGGETGKFAKVDDANFTITFKEPYGMFMQRLAGVYGVQIVMMAKHYCSQFMPTYNKDGLDALMKEAGVGTWTELFIKKCAVDTEANERWQNPQRPTMEPWVIKDPYIGGASLVTLERNPYYFKVDPEGNQLPYIDDMSISVNADKQTLVLKVVNGEIDYQDRHVNDNANRAVFTDAADKAQIHLVDGPNADMNTTIISLNLTSKDPVKREIFNNKDFRIGLSYAIDRQAIIDSAFVGQGEPWQAAPRKESPYYNEKLAKQYTEYDVAKANEHLDKAYPKKDSNGFRLGPDGKRISFNIMVMPALGDFLDSTQLAAQYWQAVGIDAKVQTVDRTLFYDRKDNNEQDAAVFLGSGGMGDAIFEPTFYFPFWNETLFAVPWGNWYASGGKAGEEPPAAAKKQMEIYREITKSSDPEKQKALMKQLLDISADEFYAIGISTPGPLFSATKNNLHNVYPRPFAWTYPSPVASNTEQYYFDPVK